MYLLSYYEENSFVEASLGGKIVAPELNIFEEELVDLIEGLECQQFNLLLDYSRAKLSCEELQPRLNDIRNRCRELGAKRIVSVVPGEADLERETAHRLEEVLSGIEDYVLDPAYARFQPIVESAVVRLAA